MKRVLLFVLALAPFALSAQHFEAGIMLGGSTYQGDISPSTSAWSTNDVHAALGVFGRYNFNPYVSARLNFAYGKLSASDADANAENRRLRNLSFESSLIEFGLIGEINLLGYDPEGLTRRFSPYLFGGVSVFRFNPETNYQGQLVELQPLGTEGQGMEGFGEKYNLTQIAIPFGAGLKFAINERLNLGMEVGFRRTFTDYIDDVSGTYVSFEELLRGNGELAAILSNRSGELQEPSDTPIDVETGSFRGNPDNDDWYAIAGITISYNFYRGNGLGRKGKKDFGCPTF